jgi:hypothetical protein
LTCCNGGDVPDAYVRTPHTHRMTKNAVIHNVLRVRSTSEMKMLYAIPPLTAALLALLTCSTQAQQSESPLTITRCAMGPLERIAPAESGSISEMRTLYFTFANAGTERIDRFTISVTHGGIRYTVDDAGRWVPGVVTEDPFFGFSNDFAPAGPARCTVEGVHFINGREWSRLASSDRPS